MKKKPEDYMHTEHIFADGYYIKKCLIPQGLELDQHRHTFDHISKLVKGTATVTVDGISNTYNGPVEILIAARKIHRVKAITNIEWHCIHKTDKTDAEDIDMEFILEE